ncbi:MAG: ferredoxin, partial [Prevotellaceae bacterium]|nr:ferredoxin [Prevotellaceae bacterium]
MLVTEQESRRAAIVAAAQQMLAAARTAPKGKGRDTLALAAAYDDTLDAIAGKLDEMGKALDIPFF